MSFQFVDNNAAIDRTARRRIRSHVAMGRNAGKKVVRPSRKKAFGEKKTNIAVIRTSNVAEDAQEWDRSRQIVPEIERHVADELSVLSFPVHLTSESKVLVQRAFSFMSGPRHVPELSNALDETGSSTSMWVQLMFLDEAYFHCAVAISLTALGNLAINQEKPKEAMQHLSYTFRMVNERLSGNNAVSDATIAVVLTLSHFERLQGRHRQGVIHLEGLRRMVKLRGGISQLAKDNPRLVPKIFRADLEFSLHLGTVTRFSVDEIVPISTSIFGIPHILERQYDEKFPQVHLSLFFQQLGAELQDLLLDITYLARLLNDASCRQRKKLNHYIFHDTLILLGYRLIQYSPLGGSRPTSRFENTVHLGLTAFLMTFLRGLDRRIPDLPLLQNLSSTAARTFLEDGQDNQELLLWILFMGAASIFKQPDDAWLIPKTMKTIHALGLQTWEDAGRTLLKFPWVSAVHDKAGKALWQRSTSCDETPVETTVE